MQTIDDYNGYLLILVEPSAGTDTQTAFFISGTAQCLELFSTYGDNMILMADFNDVTDLSARLLELIGRAECERRSAS